MILRRWTLGPGYFSRWSVLAAACCVNLFTLYSYAYGLFSDTLKDSLGFSQSAVDVIASVGEAGLWSTFLVGLILERKSPREVYALGSIASGVGVGYVSLAILKVLPTNPVAMGFFFYLANFGTSCYGQSATTTVLRSFPASDRGKVAGAIKSIFGLSSAVISVLYAGLFGSVGVGRFLLFLSIGVPLVGTISSVPINVVPHKHLSYATERAQGVDPQMKPFYTWLGSVTAFLILSATPALLPFTLPVPWTGLALLLLVSTVAAVPFFYGSVYIRGSPLLLARGPSMDSDGGMEREERRGSDLAPCEFRLEDDLFGREHHPLLGGPNNGNGTHAGLGRVTDTGYGYTWKECLQDGRWWALYVGFFCGAGSGLVVINNVASIARSLGMVSSDVLVSLIGISNALGRLSAGWISDRVVAAGLPRSLLLSAMLLTTCGVDFLLAAGIRSFLYPLCVAAGCCYGSMFSLVLALTADIFGPEHVATNYGLLDLGERQQSVVR
ncbi:unnamed protein product [Ectocarpus sp. 12 AP-2014]